MAALIPLYTCSLVRDASARAEDRLAEDPKSAAKIVRTIIGDADREHLVMLALDARRRVIGAQIVSVGTATASLVHPREVFKPALLLNAAAVIVAHNHPSGDCSPSPEDRDVTRRLVRAGETLGVPVVDHIIVGEDGSLYSFREAGLI